LVHQQLGTIIRHSKDKEVGQALETISPVAKGREIFVNYGEDCNEHFVMTYGFVPYYCQAELTDIENVKYAIKH